MTTPFRRCCVSRWLVQACPASLQPVPSSTQDDERNDVSKRSQRETCIFLTRPQRTVCSAASQSDRLQGLPRDNAACIDYRRHLEASVNYEVNSSAAAVVALASTQRESMACCSCFLLTVFGIESVNNIWRHRHRLPTTSNEDVC